MARGVVTSFTALLPPATQYHFSARQLLASPTSQISRALSWRICRPLAFEESLECGVVPAGHGGPHEQGSANARPAAAHEALAPPRTRLAREGAKPPDHVLFTSHIPHTCCAILRQRALDVNQCEMSAISGAKAAELPKPITRFARANCLELGASPEAK